MPNYYIADSEQELNEHNEQAAEIEQNECKALNFDWGSVKAKGLNFRDEEAQ